MVIKKKAGRPPMPNKKRYAITLDEHLHTQAVAKAKEIGISFSTYLEICIKHDLNPQKKYKLVIDD